MHYLYYRRRKVQCWISLTTKRVVIVTTRFVVKLPQNCIFDRRGQNMCQGVKAECILLVMVWIIIWPHFNMLSYNIGSCNSKLIVVDHWQLALFKVYFWFLKLYDTLSLRVKGPLHVWFSEVRLNHREKWYSIQTLYGPYQLKKYVTRQILCYY